MLPSSRALLPFPLLVCGCCSSTADSRLRESPRDAGAAVLCRISLTPTSSFLSTAVAGWREADMGAWDRRCFFPLTSLQIGDLQSYLSRLTIFLAPDSNKFLILVDYRSCLTDWNMQPARLWQLMVIKSRLSPFANTKVKKEKSSMMRHDMTGPQCNSDNTKMGDRWLSLINSALYQRRDLLPMKKLKDSLVLNSDLHHSLYGFIVFEISWAHVRGINYLNELQTDTSMAVEAKLMKRWEFDSVQQASSSLSSWYSGTCYERSLLLEYLDNGFHTGDIFYDAPADASAVQVHKSHIYSSGEDDATIEDKLSKDGTSSDSSASVEYPESLLYTPPSVSNSCKRRKITKSTVSSDADEASEEMYSEIISSPRRSIASTSTYSSDSESSNVTIEATVYRDVLVLYRFNDCDLPFKLKEIIVSDLRLLTLLEYGLPSWVIFLQSYPVVCHIYRPWMCPLARVLYVLISFITVLIGFYDLYKNVPILKATASSICGPFFDWIENWEMISRIKYLGTMLFIHNFEIAIRWFLMASRAIRSLLAVITKPFAGPVEELVELLVPCWTACLQISGMLGSVAWTIGGTACSLIGSIMQIMFWPFWFVLSVIWTLATSILYPVCWILWEVVIAPVRFIFSSLNMMMMLCVYVYNMIKGIWSSVAPIFQFMPRSGMTVQTYEVPLWRSLWNDLFSQVFRAVKSILYGFIAFFTACNRHRLSIYNHFQGVFLHHSCASRRSEPLNSGHLLKDYRTKNPVRLSQKARMLVKNQQRPPDKAHSRRRTKEKEVSLE